MISDPKNNYLLVTQHKVDHLIEQGSVGAGTFILQCTLLGQDNFLGPRGKCLD